MLPTFIVIGAQKAGTSSLWEYLNEHPDVFVTLDKEPKFFVKERGWERGLLWYEGLFDTAGAAKARGEFSTDYTCFPIYSGVPARMASLVPDVKLIYLMRNPLERMRSAYAYGLWQGTETRTIGEALRVDARYHIQSQYALQIEQYADRFSPSQMLFVTSEDLRQQRRETMSRIFSFIGVDPTFVPANLVEDFNTAQGRTRPRPWARHLGDAIIKTHLDEHMPSSLESVIGRIGNHALARTDIHPSDVEVPDDLADALVRYLRHDLASLRNFMGPSFDCWGLSEPTALRSPSLQQESQLGT